MKILNLNNISLENAMKKIVLHYACIDTDTREVKKEFKVALLFPTFEKGKLSEKTLDSLCEKSKEEFRKNIGEEEMINTDMLRYTIDNAWR